SLPLHSLLFCYASATSEFYTLSLHDALPIFRLRQPRRHRARVHRQPWPASGFGGRDRQRRLSAGRWDRDHQQPALAALAEGIARDRKSTRLNSSHVKISYAVFCLKKKKIAER